MPRPGPPRVSPYPWALTLLGLAACMEPPPDSAGADAGSGPVVHFETHDGQPVPAWDLPRRPRVRVDLPLEPPLEAAVWLLEGEATPALLEDAARRPLLAATTARAVALDVAGGPTGPFFEPRAPLRPGASYTLLLPAWAVDGAVTAGWTYAPPWAISLRVSAASTHGAAVRTSLPADGASAVPVNVQALRVALDGSLRADGPALRLLDAAGATVDATVADEACEGFDAGAVHCLALTPNATLQPNAAYALTLAEDAVDLRGGPLADWRANFRTAAHADTQPPHLLALTCGRDERAIAGLCVLSDDRSLRVRLRAGEAVHVVGALGGEHLALPAPRGEATLAFDGLPPARRLDLALTLTDAAGQQLTLTTALQTMAPLASLTISEVRSDPLGPEPAQELVELYNFGPQAIAVEGFTLADAPERDGSPLPPASIPGGSTALVVGAGFDPDDPEDGPIPPGTLLIRLSGGLGKSGLSNAGEPLVLRDAAGNRLAAAPAVRTGSGACLQRTAPRARGGLASDFGVVPSTGCSPGRGPQ